MVHYRKSLPLVAFAALIVSSQIALAADEPKKPEPAKPDVLITDMRIQKFPAVTIVYAQTETTLNKIAQYAQPSMAAIEKAMVDAKLPMQGGPIFVYDGATGQPDQPFKLTIGFPVPEGSKAAGDYQVKKLAEIRCATVIYSGPMPKIGEGFSKLFQSLMAAGHMPTGETREHYLYWESADSPNNIVLIQAGIK